MMLRNLKNIEIREGRNKGTCDFCNEQGRTFKMVSKHRQYRFLSVCDNCLRQIRRGFRKSRLKE